MHIMPPIGVIVTVLVPPLTHPGMPSGSLSVSDGSTEQVPVAQFPGGVSVSEPIVVLFTWTVARVAPQFLPASCTLTAVTVVPSGVGPVNVPLIAPVEQVYAPTSDPQ